MTSELGTYGDVFNNFMRLSKSGNNKLCEGIPELKLSSCNFEKTLRIRLSHNMRLILGAFGLIL